jgi:hypothetical protein
MTTPNRCAMGAAEEAAIESSKRKSPFSATTPSSEKRPLMRNP